MDYMETLARWQELKIALAKLTAEEKALREGIFNGTFENPEEGVNTVELPDGRKLKGTYKIYRNVDEDKFGTLDEELQAKLFRVKHDLSTAEYRKLDTITRKKVDRVLTIKPGLPSLEIVEAKEQPVPEVQP